MASTKLLLFSSKKLKNGEHPVVLRIIKDRKIKYISLGYSTTPPFWRDGDLLLKDYPNSKKINHVLRKKKADMDDIILDYENDKKSYSLEELEQKFLRSVKKTTVFSYCEEIIDRLMGANKVGNSYVYKDLLRTLKKFRKEHDLEFSDISYSFLMKYEEDFLKTGVSENSISVYMRTLRSLINKAIKEGFCREEDYAFNKYKISKLSTQTRKRAITKDEMLKIINYDTESQTSLWHSKNYFLFSFYTVGMNLHDMALLKWSDILNGRIHYVRAKTGKHYDIKIQPRIQEILDFYVGQNENTHNYVFPILNKEIHQTARSIKDRIKRITKRVNKDLKKIAELVDIKGTHSITHYVARHSWASIQKQNGTGISMISESMGHDSEKTTQIYLQSFVHDILDEVNANLI
jgi:site-specific recombinase XerD